MMVVFNSKDFLVCIQSFWIIDFLLGLMLTIIDIGSGNGWKYSRERDSNQDTRYPNVEMKPLITANTLFSYNDFLICTIML